MKHMKSLVSSRGSDLEHRKKADSVALLFGSLRSEPADSTFRGKRTGRRGFGPPLGRAARAKRATTRMELLRRAISSNLFTFRLQLEFTQRERNTQVLATWGRDPWPRGKLSDLAHERNFPQHRKLEPTNLVKKPMAVVLVIFSGRLRRLCKQCIHLTKETDFLRSLPKRDKDEQQKSQNAGSANKRCLASKCQIP